MSELLQQAMTIGHSLAEPLYIDNSTLKAEQRCSTEVMLRYHHGYTTPEERAVLKAGTAFHSLAEVHFKGGGPAEAMAAFSESYEAWATENVLITDRLSYPNLSRICKRWLEAHPLATLPFTVNPDLVEVGFAFPLVEDGSIVFCGRLDGVVLYQNDLWTLEHKTTGRIQADWLDAFALDSQMSGYIWAAMQHTGKAVAGAFLDAVEFSKLPGGITVSGNTPKRCPDHKVLYDECGDLHATFRMVLVSRTPAAIAEWHKTAVHLAKRYRDRLVKYPSLEHLHKVRMQGTFNAQSACRFCQFKTFCKLDRPLTYIADNMIHEPWKPYEYATLQAEHTGKA